jgi:opacity protein-like surface antigen
MAAHRGEIVVVRLRLALTVFGVLLAVSANAQSTSAIYIGQLTGHVGAAAGSDIRGKAVTPGVSASVTDVNGLGAELDVGYSPEVDDSQFASSAVTSLTVNAIGIWQKFAVRPYLVGGIGLLRVRADAPDIGLAFSRTDWALDAGAGVFYMLNDIFAIRGEVRYFRFLQGTDGLPLRLGGSFFEYWRTSIGATYAWPLK